MPSSLHFSAAEIGAASSASIPSAYEANAFRTLQGLEAFRALLGVPLHLTSFYRTPDHNALIGGSETSDHMLALAADVVPIGASLVQVASRILAAEASGKMPPVDQVIFYPFTTGHLHLGFGARMRGELLVRLADKDVPDAAHPYRPLVNLAQVRLDGPSAVTLALGMFAALVVAKLGGNHKG